MSIRAVSWVSVAVLGVSWAAGCSAGGGGPASDRGDTVEVSGREVSEHREEGGGDAGDMAEAHADTEVGPCPWGPNPSGNGCLLPCENGWHEGADGQCFADCPSFLGTDESGDCTVPVCGSGWRVREWQATWEDKSFAASVCVRACPEGMEEREENGVYQCAMPCPEGSSQQDDGYCHLDCPEGMFPGEGAVRCVLDVVGENKACPTGKWDLEFLGPNPLFVAAGADAAQADGSEEHPFATIAAAVAAAKGSATVYVAAGEYHEQVVVEDLDEFNLVGACAAETLIVAEGIGPLNGWYSGAVFVYDVDEASIQGISIVSSLKGVVVVHEGTGERAEVSGVRVLEAESFGIFVAGAFKRVVVQGNVVEGAKDWGIAVLGDADGLAVELVQAEVTGNEVTGLQLCVGWQWCQGSGINDGIVVGKVGSALVAGNLVHGFDHASGLWLFDVPSLVVRGNQLADLVGHSAIAATCWVACEATFDGNWMADCQAGEWGGFEPFAVSGMELSPNGHECTFEITRNYVGSLQGVGLSIMDDGSAGSAVSARVEGNELEKLPWGMELATAGTYAVIGNSVSENLLLLSPSVQVEALTVKGNVFRDGATTDWGLPSSSFKEFLKDISKQMALTADYEKGQIEFRSNLVRGFPSLPAELPSVIAVMGGKTAVLADNVFESNASEAVVSNVACEDVVLSGNRFVGMDPSPYGQKPAGGRSAFVGLGGDAGHPAKTKVVGNSFEDFAFGASVWFYYWEGEGEMAVEGNSFVQGGRVDLESVDGGGPAQVTLTGNDCLWTDLYSDSVDDLVLADSRVVASFVLAHGQRPGGEMLVEGNLFDSCPLYLVRQDGTVSVQGNEFRNSDAEGVEVLATTGTTLIHRNLVNAVQSYELPLAGMVGDGIHVSGTADEPVTGVDVWQNRVAQAERLGVVFSGAEGRAEANMYCGNGGECGLSCDFVIQLEPFAGAVTGADVSFATRPGEPYGVVTADLHSGL